MALIQGEPGKGIVLKEYGKNIQKIVDWILTIEDRDQRSRYAHICIELMRQLNPGVRDTQEHTSKLWDHLFIMSNFKLDIDSQFEMPDKSILGKKPQRVPYVQQNLKYKHYGRNVSLLIKEALLKTDPTEKENAIIYLGRLMKRLYSTWNKENVDDEVIVMHLAELSKNELLIDSDKVKREKLFDTVVTSETKPFAYGSSGNGGGGNNSSGYSRSGGQNNGYSQNRRSGGGNGGGSNNKYQQNNKPRRRS